MTAAPPPDDWPDDDWPDAADLAALFAATAPDPPPFDAARCFDESRARQEAQHALPVGESPRVLTGAARAAPGRILSSPFPDRRSLLMKLSAAALAAAGLCAAALWLAPEPALAKVTFEEVKAAVEESPLMTATIYRTNGEGGSAASERVHLARNPIRIRTERLSGDFVQVDHFRERYSLRVDADEGYVHMDKLDPGLPPLAALDYDALSNRLHKEPAEVERDGRRLWLFETGWRQRSRSYDGSDDDGSEGTTPTKIWIDPQSKLPVRWEFGADQPVVFQDVVWADSFDPRLFPALPPAVEADLRRTVIAVSSAYASPSMIATLKRNNSYVPFLHNGREELAAAAFGAAFGPVLTPGEGLGPLRFGMTAEQVDAATGVPTFWIDPETFWFFLPSWGVSARGTAADGVVQIYVGVNPLFRFPGTIAGGVTTGMDGAELERRLGPPDPTGNELDGRQTTRTYAARRLWIKTRDRIGVRASIWSPAAEPLP